VRFSVRVMRVIGYTEIRYIDKVISTLLTWKHLMIRCDPLSIFRVIKSNIDLYSECITNYTFHVMCKKLLP